MQSARFIIQRPTHHSLLLSRRIQNTLVTSQKRLITKNALRRKAGPSGAQASALSPRTSDEGKAKEVPTTTRDKVVEAMEEEQDRLPFLQRPLGVRGPPSTESKS